MYFTYWLFNWFAISYHVVALTSHRVVREKEITIKQSTDLFNPEKPQFLDWKAGSPFDRSFLNSAAKNGPTKVQRLVENLETFPAPVECVLQLFKRRRYTCLTTESKLQFLVASLPSKLQADLYISRFEQDASVATFVVPKHFPFLKTMDKYIALFFETGILKHWEQELQAEVRRLRASERSFGMRRIPNSKDLSDNIEPGDLLKSLLVIHGAAIIVFLVEFCGFHWERLRETMSSGIWKFNSALLLDRMGQVAWGQKFRNALFRLCRPALELVKVRPSSLP